MKIKDGKEKGTVENTIVAGCYDPQRLRELAEADKDGRVKSFRRRLTDVAGAAINSAGYRERKGAFAKQGRVAHIGMALW